MSDDTPAHALWWMTFAVVANAVLTVCNRRALDKMRARRPFMTPPPPTVTHVALDGRRLLPGR